MATCARKRAQKEPCLVPDDMSQAKYDGMVSYGVDVVKNEGDPINGEKNARKFAAENDIPFISPYNDPQIVGGQGTIGFELFSEVQDLGRSIYFIRRWRPNVWDRDRYGKFITKDKNNCRIPLLIQMS